MKLKFTISYKAEEKSPIIQSCGISQLIPEIREEFVNLSPKERGKYIQKLYKEERNKLNDSKKLLEDIWKVISKEYEKEVSNILDIKLKDKTCYVSPSINGLADVISGNSVFINHWSKPLSNFTKKELLTYLLIHELTHLFYADKLRELNLKDGMKSSLVEGVDHLIVFYSPLEKLLSKRFKEKRVGFINKNKKFMGELIKSWNKRENFEEFIKKAIEIDKKFTGVIIC